LEKRIDIDRKSGGMGHPRFVARWSKQVMV
jgi:hypothetical protein